MGRDTVTMCMCSGPQNAEATNVLVVAKLASGELLVFAGYVRRKSKTTM